MRALLAGLCFLLLSTDIAQAADAAPASDAWRVLTRTDVEAAYALLEENHPAAVPEVGDTAFTSGLAAAHAKALARAAEVTGFPGYVATMGEFAGSMGDTHIWSNSVFLPRMIQWAGLIAAKRGPDWVVANEDSEIAGARLIGARIVGCDDQPADQLAREALRFRGNLANPAVEIIKGGWLLLDEGNPFLRRPRACVFEQDGKRQSLALHWSAIGRDQMLSKYWVRPYGQSGFGLRQSGAGFWIGIQELTPAAQPVIDAVAARQDEIRAAPYVVLDLRGDGGGDDQYGRALANKLYGPDYVASVLGPAGGESGACEDVFRASSGNIEAAATAARTLGEAGDTAAAKEAASAVNSMTVARAAGRALAGRLVCPSKIAAKSRSAPSLMRGKVLVLTDALCFSSCIETVDYFRQLGAVQVGQPTGADTHYSEVREIVLPSGLSTFSTLQAVMPDRPRAIGPYRPTIEYTGDIADTAALEKWAATADAAGSKRSPS